MRKLSSILTIFLVLCLTVGGVSAAWVYAGGAVEALTDILASVGMGTWEFGYTLTFKNEGRMFLEKQMNEGDTIDLYSTAKGSPIYKLWEQIKDFQKNDPGNLKVDYSNFDTSTVEKFKENHFDYWINAGSTRVDSIESDRTEDLVLFPTFQNLYTAIFVDKNGNVVEWDTFTSKSYDNILDMGIKGRNDAKYVTPPEVDHFEFQYWQVQLDKNSEETVKLEEFDFSTVTGDITIYPVYLYDGDVTIAPLDTDGDGKPNEYHVSGYKNPTGTDLVNIPDYIDGVPVTTIEANAFSSYDGVHAIVIPSKIKTVGGNALAIKWDGRFDSGETIDIYFAGSYKQWTEIEPSFDPNWESGISSSSHIFFLNGGDKVDVGEGYLQAKVSTNYFTGSKSVSWTYNSKVTEDIIKTFYTQCKVEDDHPYHDYDQEAGDIRLDGWRPDYLYWGEPDGSKAIDPAS